MNWQCRLGFHKEGIAPNSRWLLGREFDIDPDAAELWTFWHCARCGEVLRGRDSGERWRVKVESQDVRSLTNQSPYAMVVVDGERWNIDLPPGYTIHYDRDKPVRVEAPRRDRWREFVTEFVSWADDGEGDDDGLLAKARALLNQ